jgi:two-component system response regulator DevR
MRQVAIERDRMEQSSKVKVLIVDDHPVVRAGLRTITDADPQLEIIAEAASASEALTAARQLNPAVVLLDIRLPDQSGFEVCRTVKKLLKPPAVLFLTSFADNALILDAMESGADGYLLKGNHPAQIAAAIRTVLKGGSVFDPVPAVSAAFDPIARLSRQELRVLSEISTGKTDKEAASKLGLQVKTVRHYLDNIFEKLRVNTRTQAAMVYIKRGSLS